MVGEMGMRGALSMRMECILGDWKSVVVLGTL